MTFLKHSAQKFASIVGQMVIVAVPMLLVTLAWLPELDNLRSTARREIRTLSLEVADLKWNMRENQQQLAFQMDYLATDIRTARRTDRARAEATQLDRVIGASERAQAARNKSRDDQMKQLVDAIVGAALNDSFNQTINAGGKAKATQSKTQPVPHRVYYPFGEFPNGPPKTALQKLNSADEKEQIEGAHEAAEQFGTKIPADWDTPRARAARRQILGY